MTTLRSTYARTLPHLSPEAYPSLSMRPVSQNYIYVPRKTGLDPVHELLLGILATNALQHAGRWQPILFKEFMDLAQRTLYDEEYHRIKETLSLLQKSSIEIIHVRKPEERAYIFPMPSFARVASHASVWEAVHLSKQLSSSSTQLPYA